jgi:hypothetical protein
MAMAMAMARPWPRTSSASIPMGLQAKPSILANAPKAPRSLPTYQLSDLRLLRLAPECALLSYRAEFQRVNNPASEAMYVSSIWQKGDLDWLNIFSQDTPAIS